MPKIDIDDDIWQALQDRATPLVDTPTSVLRRLLGLPSVGDESLGVPPKMRKVGVRAEGRTPQEAYRMPILGALFSAGGSMQASKVLEHVKKSIGNQFNAVDLEMLKSGRDIRWRNAAQWERAAMVKAGLLKNDSPRKIWEITDKGARLYRKIILESE